MHGELQPPRGPPRIEAAVIPIHGEKGEMESLLHNDKGELESLLHNQQEARYYNNLPEVAVNFTVPPSSPMAPPPQYEEHEWQPTLSKERHQVNKANWFGIFLAFMSGAFFTLSSAAVKALKSMDPMELLVLRSLLQVFAMLPIALRRGENLFGPKGQRGLLQLQGIVGGSTLVLLFFTFRRLPLGDATTIIFSSPVFVMIMSFLFLREPCGFFRTLIVFLLLTGVVLISKPPFIFQTFAQEYDLFGYLCALGATLFTALNIVVMRKCKEVHFSVVVLQLSLWSLLVSSTVLATAGRKHHEKLLSAPHGPYEWGLAVLVSVLGLTGQVLVAKALGMEGAGRVAVTRSLDIVLAFVLQVFAFGEVPDLLSISGALLVLLCVMGMGMEEQILYLASLVP
ncbi:solute carrier family 35 member G1-like [Periplaneta americana]|uniref:solute carrier family 35 member G1-like n=1 Tax=Periplaneta americana TaxID=6978 RepID=UPI0037E783D9